MLHAAVSMAVGLWLALVAAPRSDPHFRRHYKHLAAAWALLALYYAGAASWPSASNAAAGPWPLGPGPLRPQLHFHFLTILVCNLTNFFLWKAVADVQADRKRTLHEALRWIVPLTVAWSLCVSGGIGWVPVGRASVATAVVLAYIPPLLVASALFVALGQVYASAYSKILGAVCVGYGVLQLFWPLPATHDFAAKGLTVAKVLLVLALAKRAPRQVAGSEPLDDLASLTDVLQKLAPRLYLERDIQRAIQRSVGIASLAAAAVAGLLLTPWALERSAHYAQGSIDIHLEIVLLALSIWLPIAVGLVLLWQVLTYAARYVAAPRVKWRIVAHNELQPYVNYEKTVVAPKWTRAVVERKVPSKVATAQVVLVHGLFSTCANTWGLLPAWILAAIPDVERVVLIDYRHGLLSRRRHLSELGDELQAQVEAITANGRTTILVGHSLGALLLLNLGPGTAHRLRGVVGRILVAAPITGSSLAKFGVPWPWLAALAPGSSYMRELAETAVRAAVHLRGKLGTVAMIWATGDRIIERKLKDWDTQVNGTHSSAAEVFELGREKAEPGPAMLRQIRLAMRHGGRRRRAVA